MKLFYLANSIVPSKTANSVHVMKMCQALSKNNFIDNVELCIPLCEERGLNIYDYYGVENSFNISRLKKGTSRFSWYKFSVRQLLYINKNANKKDVVYGRNFLSCMFLALFNYKVIYECHSPISRYNILVRFLFKFFSHKFLKVIVISSKLKEIILKETSIPSNHLEVLHDAADPTPKRLLPMTNKEQFNVGYIGHLYEGRGVELLLKIAIRLPQVHFNFFGGEDEDIERLKADIPKNITFHGYLDPSKVPLARAKMNVLLAPYQYNTSIQGLVNTANYMSPLKIFEYMSSNRPLICSDLPVLREVLTNNVNSLLVDAEDENSWINAIDRLKTDSNLANQLATQALNDFQLSYSWDTRAKKIVEIYNANC